MSDKFSNYLVTFVFVAMLAVTAMSFLKQTENKAFDDIYFQKVNRTNVGPHIWIPESKVVDISELELVLNTDKQQYLIGERINCSVYLVNNYPYKVRVLPQDQVIHYRELGDFEGNIVPPVKYIDSNKIELKPNSSLCLASFLLGPQEQNGSFLIDVHYNSLRALTKVEVNKEKSVDFSENNHIIDADDRFIEVNNKEFFNMNETALFKVSNNSTVDGMSSNVGWRIEQSIDGQWVAVLEPESYLMGVMYVFPAGGSFTRSIRLEGLKPGDYRLKEAIRVNETRITAISYFTIH